MTDEQATLNDLKRWVLTFSRERNWEQFHHPKDLGVALACEVGELLEHFRFRTHEEIQDFLQEPEHNRELAHELADCLWMILRLADVCGIDLSAALREKIELAGVKYPVEQSFGRPDKYTRYRNAERPTADS
jgi:dCTP diphosphatase